MRERGRPALQDVWVCERGVDGHVLPIPVVRRKQEPLRVEHARVGAAERHDDVGLWRRGERDPVAVAERRAVDAGPDRQRLAAHGGEGDVVLDDLARHIGRTNAVVVGVGRARHEPDGVVAVAGEYRRRRRRGTRTSRARPSRRARRCGSFHRHRRRRCSRTRRRRPRPRGARRKTVGSSAPP